MRAARNMAGDETSGASSNVRYVSICGFCHDAICFYACTISYSICLVAHIVFISFLPLLTHYLQRLYLRLIWWCNFIALLTYVMPNIISHYTTTLPPTAPMSSFKYIPTSTITSLLHRRTQHQQQPPASSHTDLITLTDLAASSIPDTTTTSTAHGNTADSTPKYVLTLPGPPINRLPLSVQWYSDAKGSEDVYDTSTYTTYIQYKKAYSFADVCYKNMFTHKQTKTGLYTSILNDIAHKGHNSYHTVEYFIQWLVAVISKGWDGLVYYILYSIQHYNIVNICHKLHHISLIVEYLVVVCCSYTTGYKRYMLLICIVVGALMVASV